MRLHSSPLVSVVTPFYNTDSYLAECIESVLAQSYGNWEYVLVNNCSTDRSYEIAKSYAERESRIRLINNDVFLGQVKNYNHALRHISDESKYCKIVQADDWLFPECLAEMVSVAIDNPTVGIVGSYYLCGIQVGGSGLPYPSTVTPGGEICKWHLLNHPEMYLFGSPTSLMFRSDLIRARNPFYDENSLLEDYEVCYEVLKESDFGFVHKLLTFLRVSDESLTEQIIAYGPYVLHAFICLKKYGSCYLSENEYQQRLKYIETRYYKSLASAFVQRYDKGFWEYHNSGLLSIDYKVDKMLFLKHVVLELLDLARHPKAAFRTLTRYLRS